MPESPFGVILIRKFPRISLVGNHHVGKSRIPPFGKSRSKTPEYPFRATLDGKYPGPPFQVNHVGRILGIPLSGKLRGISQNHNFGHITLKSSQRFPFWGKSRWGMFQDFPFRAHHFRKSKISFPGKSCTQVFANKPQGSHELGNLSKS